MAAKHRLDPEDEKVANRILAWLLILFGIVISMGIAADPAGWDDPAFNVVRKLPYTPYSWAGLLVSSTAVYCFGELSNYRRRGNFVITGAAMCSIWCASLSCMMARMVYEMPSRITVLWPFVTFFMAALYASRVIVYASTFHGRRWATNPFQLWLTMFVMIVSLSQVIIGVAPGSIFTEVERPVMLQLALVNLLGSSIVMFGLHMKNEDLGLNYELAGTFSLMVSLAWYCTGVTERQVLAGTTLGFGLVEGYVFASLHRSIQITTLRWAERRGRDHQASRLRNALTTDRHIDNPVK